MAHDVADGWGNRMARPEGQGVDHAKAGATPQEVVVDHPIVVVVEEGAGVGHPTSHQMPLRQNKLSETSRGQKGNSGQLRGNVLISIPMEL